MAQRLSFFKGSPYSGDPILYKVKADVVPIRQGIDRLSAHYACLDVYVRLKDVGYYQKFPFTKPVSQGEKVEFDISAALKSVAESHTYEPITTNGEYPVGVIEYYLEAYDKYVLNNVQHDQVNIRIVQPGLLETTPHLVAESVKDSPLIEIVTDDFPFYPDTFYTIEARSQLGVDGWQWEVPDGVEVQGPLDRASISVKAPIGEWVLCVCAAVGTERHVKYYVLHISTPGVSGPVLVGDTFNARALHWAYPLYDNNQSPRVINCALWPPTNINRKWFSRSKENQIVWGNQGLTEYDSPATPIWFTGFKINDIAPIEMRRDRQLTHLKAAIMQFDGSEIVVYDEDLFQHDYIEASFAPTFGWGIHFYTTCAGEMAIWNVQIFGWEAGGGESPHLEMPTNTPDNFVLNPGDICSIDVNYKYNGDSRGADFQLRATQTGEYLDFTPVITEDHHAQSFRFSFCALTLYAFDADGIINLSLINNGREYSLSIPFTLRGFRVISTSLIGKSSDADLIANPEGEKVLYAEDMSSKPIVDYFNEDVLPEVVPNGSLFLSPQIGGEGFLRFDAQSNFDKPFVSAMRLDAPGMRRINGRQVYITPDEQGNSQYLQFQFVNRYGVVESYCVNTDLQTENESQEELLNLTETREWGNVQRRFIDKQYTTQMWQVTSGPLDRHWLKWFLHEFLASERVWVLVTPQMAQIEVPHFFPCTLAYEDTVKCEKESSSNVRSVKFSVKVDILGLL